MVDVGKVSGGTYFQKPQNETNTQQEQSLISIFNSNNDNTFSVEEQKNAYNSEIDKFCEKFKDLLEEYNFNLENFKTEIFQKLKDQDIEHPIAKEVVESNIRQGILNAKEQIINFIKSEPERRATNVGEGWGQEEAHIAYIVNKLEENGIGINNIDREKLSNILSSFDYDLDPDLNGIITTSEAKYGEEHMDKDVDGNITDTKVLDWIINKYLGKIQ